MRQCLILAFLNHRGPNQIDERQSSVRFVTLKQFGRELAHGCEVARIASEDFGGEFDSRLGLLSLQVDLDEQLGGIAPSF